jgi:hypothetical protein
MRDAEVALASRRLLFDLHRFDLSQRRTFAAPGDHLVHGVGVAFEHRLDAAVGQILRVPAHPQVASSPRALHTEEHALHLPGDQHLDPFLGHVGQCAP